MIQHQSETVIMTLFSGRTGSQEAMLAEGSAVGSIWKKLELFDARKQYYLDS